jgi:hypothetical protein
MSDSRRPWGTARITMLVLLVVVVVGIGVVFVLQTADEAREREERSTYAGKWVREGSSGDDYIVLNADGTYSVHVSGYTGSIQDESWGVRDGSIFIPTEVKLTVGGPGSGDEKVYGWYLEVRGDRLISGEGNWKGTYRRQ